MVSQGSSIQMQNAHVHCSISNNDLSIHPMHALPTADNRHVRRSLEGILLGCCSRSKPFRPRTISLYDVISASYDRDQLQVCCVRRDRKRHVVKTYSFEGLPVDEVANFAQAIWSAAYRKTVPRKRALVLLNPFGGSGKALSIWETIVKDIFLGAKYIVNTQETQYSGHAVQIAAQLDLDQYDVIVCVSGDGLPHEVINGLGSRDDAAIALKLPVAFIPAGSGNGSAKSIYDTHDQVECALAVVKGQTTPIDLISMTQGNRRFLSYFSTSFGVIADCDLGTEHLRWMGEARFTYGVLQRIFTRTCYPCTLALSIITEDKTRIRQEYHDRTLKTDTEPVNADVQGSKNIGLPKLRYGTVNDSIPESWKIRQCPKMGTFYVGLMPYMSSTTCFFPTATPASGALDIMYIQADLPFFSAIKTVSEVDSAKHFDSEYCYYAKCDAFRLIPDEKHGFISVDGEKVEFRPIQGEIHHALGRIITKNGSFYSEFSE